MRERTYDRERGVRGVWTSDMLHVVTETKSPA